MSTVVMFGPTDHGRRVTEEELAQAQWQEGYRYEIIHGRIYVSPIPRPAHDVLVDWIADHLKAYARAHPDVINKVTRGAGVHLPEAEELTAPEPDIAAYADFPLTQRLQTLRWEDLHPCLVVEVLSVDNADKDLVRNVDLYLEVPSIREYWILDPRQDADEPSLYVYRRRGARWQKRLDYDFGSEYTTRLLPGFSLLIDPRST